MLPGVSARSFFPPAAFCLTMGLLAGCATPAPPVAANESPVASRPTRILLRDFSVDPAAVRIDETALSIRGRLSDTDTPDAFREVDAGTARDMVATTLAFRLKQLGFDVVRGPATQQAEPGQLVIDGRLDRIDEGDRALRRADPDTGRAVVSGRVNVLAEGSDGWATEIAAFDDDSDAHRPPGLPGATAAEAAALAVGGIRARELLRASVSAESRRLANALADRIKTLFVEKGWVVAS
jgi:hypothetical protein